MATDISQFKRKRKSKKGKKSKLQLDEERKAREAERAKRDAERAKKRLALKAKIAESKAARKEKKVTMNQTAETKEAEERERRKKVLRFRQAQSRFALPKISPDDDMETISKANAELEAAMNATDNTNDNTTQTEANKPTETETNKSTETESNDDEKKEDEGNIDDDTDTHSVHSVEELSLSPEQEQSLHLLISALEASDPDYYGFVDYKKFISILGKNDVKLSAKHETYLTGALTLIDEGVDYYDFARKIREVGRELQPDNTLQDICEEIAETVEKEEQQKSKEKEAVPTTDLTKMSSADIVNVDEAEFEAFYSKAVQNRGRGMSLARMNETSSDVDKETELGALIDDLALDGADVDFALLKMALTTIDCYPSDKDLKYLINHLCEGDSGFVDFNYLLTFLQETSGVPVKKWRSLEKIISKVVHQLMMVERAEARKKQQELKLKERLQKKRNTWLANKNKGNDEMAQLEAEEKRLRALRLREKAKGIKK